MNEGIKVNIKEARLKRETAKIEKELEHHYNKTRKKPKQKRIGGLTVEEIHEKMRMEKREQLEAKRRHLRRAYAGIDRSQFEKESALFKTITRDQAAKMHGPHP